MADRHDVQLRTQLLEKIFPSIDTVDNLDSDNPNRPLSARQGKVLKELIESSGGGSGLSIEIVESLPTVGTKGILYLVPKVSYLKEENTYDEYVWIESSSKYEMLGSFSTDLNIDDYINKFNSILGEIQEINVATLGNSEINAYTTTGTYRVYGERINESDGLPILNAANGHTVEGILKVYNSSISGTSASTDKVVTQMLSMSNRLGGDGHIWIRTGQGASEDNLTWSTWEKLQGIFEKNTISNIEELNTFTTNGIYSCMYIGPDSIMLNSGDTLLVIVVNGYMASSIGMIPHITQSIIKTAAANHLNKIIVRSAMYLNNTWNFENYETIKLGSFCGCYANIGDIADPNSRINIGTYGSKSIDIGANTFIGYPNNQFANIDDESTVIKDKVRLEENVFIGTNATSTANRSYSVIIDDGVCIGKNVAIGTDAEAPDWTQIGKGVRLMDDNGYFYAYSYNRSCSLNISNNTDIFFNGSNTGTITFGKVCDIDIEVPNIVFGKGPFSIYTTSDSIKINEGLEIGKNVNIGGDVTIGTNTIIGTNVKIYHDVKIGTETGRIYIGDDVNIEHAYIQKVTIGSDVIINDGVRIDKNVNIGSNVFISNNLHITNDSVDSGTVVINNNGSSFIIRKNTTNVSTAYINFNENNIVFEFNNKTATISLE